MHTSVRRRPFRLWALVVVALGGVTIGVWWYLGHEDPEVIPAVPSGVAIVPPFSFPSTTSSPTSPSTTEGVIVSSTTTTHHRNFLEVKVEPGDDLAALVGTSPPGTTFVLQPGIHMVDSIEPRDGMSFIGEPGAIVSGGGNARRAFGGSADDVTIEGLIIERFANPPQSAAVQMQGSGWQILQNEVRENTGAGVWIGDRAVVVGNNIHHNHQIGVLANGAVDARVADNEIAFNNYRTEYEMAWEAGGSKFIATRGLLVEGNYVHDNHGAGLWTDYDNIDTVYRDNIVIGNLGPGIFHEVSFDAVISGNRVEGNATAFYMGGILVANSTNVEVFANHVEGNNGGVLGIQDDRGAGTLGPFEVRNLAVYRNDISHEKGYTGIRDNTKSGAVFEWNNSFSSNTYGSNPHLRLWIWADGEQNLAEWTEKGLG